MKNLLKYLFLIVICFIFAFPFVWMLSSTTNTSLDIIKGRILPGTFLIENFKNLITTVPMSVALVNSIRNAFIGTVLSLFVCSMAGYGFRVYRDKAKDKLMSLLLLSMMVPFATLMIPLFRMFSQVGLLSSTVAVVLPSISTAFLIFFFRQNSTAFPEELIQAARIDGLNEFSIYLRIFCPVMMPTFAAAGIITFMAQWNNYLWPLIVLQTNESQTLPLVVAKFTSGYTVDYGQLMLAIALYTLPILVVFLSQQKRFVSGIVGSIK